MQLQRQALGRSCFAFPHDETRPTRLLQAILDLPVAFHVPLEFLGPEIGSLLRPACFRTVRVSVPEASVDEHDFTPPGKHDIRSTGQVSAMQAIPVVHRVEQATDNHLGLRVATSNGGHDPATKWIDVVERGCHRPYSARCLRIVRAIARPRSTGTAFPIRRPIDLISIF